MALKGELTDLSLAELIEFFCNQRKTGRLAVSYPQSPAYFYLQSGSVVHASVGSLRGIDAVYYALTQSNASFSFSTAYEAPTQTINQPWTSVVLEGLRRMDEGIEPRDPFTESSEAVAEASDLIPEAAVVAPVVDAPFHQTKTEHIEHLVEPHPVEEPPVLVSQPVVPMQVAAPPVPIATSPAHKAVKQEVSVEPKEDVVIERPKQQMQRPPVSDGFLSSTHGPSKSSYAPWKLAAVFAALVLIIAGIAVPWSWRVRGKAAKVVEQSPVVSEPAQVQNTVATDNSQSSAGEVASQDGAGAAPANADATDAARREREARAREEARLRAKTAEANANPTATQSSSPATTSSATSTQAPSVGPRKVVVTVTYDENGRVTQASGSDATALRIARQKRFPPGKAGSTTITIPIN
jgi:Domain of unknown function (DUF4388)